MGTVNALPASPGATTTPATSPFRAPPVSSPPVTYSVNEAPTLTGTDRRIIESWSSDWDSATPKLSPADKQRLQTEFIARLQATQLTNYRTDTGKTGTPGSPELRRGEHAKGLFAVLNGRVRVTPDLPPELEGGPFAPEASLRAVVRFSHGPPVHAISDEEPSHPGISLRLTDDKGHTQDLIFSTGTAGFSLKDGVSGVVALETQAARRQMKPPHGLERAADAWALATTMLPQLAREHGWVSAAQETIQFARDMKAVTHDADSLANLTYFGKAPLQLGEKVVRFRLVPVEPRPHVSISGFDDYRSEFKGLLAKQPVRFLLQAQGFQNAQRTTMKDARDNWEGSSFVTIAELELPQQALTDAAVLADLATVNALAFTPTNRWSQDPRALKPLGLVNETREVLYAASAKFRASGGDASHQAPRDR
ncbi:MAG: hypothetical protein K1X64_09405 [Myxococcaceae bacterium]|nr:hypothetical protein [Myxococcaceae bacterium]